MNKKEVAEIKKTLKVDKHCIDRITACYVTPSKEKQIVDMDKIHTMDEGHLQKFLDIFKKSISGSIGKQLNCLTFNDSAEEDGGVQNLLHEIDKDGLKDEDRNNELFDRIIENYENDGYYCIIAMHAVYDVVSKHSDGEDGDSDDVYSHIICSICPMTLTKPFLSYDNDSHTIEDGQVSWMIDMPKSAFMFPSFTDRTANIHEVLVYNKKGTEVDTSIIEGVLECSAPASADEQTNAFVTSTQAAFDNNITYEQVSSIHDALTEQITSADEEVTVSPATIRAIIENEDGVSLDAFDAQYKHLMGNNDIFLANIVDKNKFVVKMDGLTIMANNDTKDLISVKEMDGRKCLVISANGGLEVNGIQARVL